MREYSLSVKENGYAVLTRSYWNPDRSFKAMEEKPYLFEVGMKVVDSWLNVVTIKEIDKRPSMNGEAPQWAIRVGENGNTYLPYELAGILVRDDIPPYQLDALIKGL